MMTRGWKVLLVVMLGLSAYSAWVSWSRPQVNISFDLPNMTAWEDEPRYEPPKDYEEAMLKFGLRREDYSDEGKKDWDAKKILFEQDLRDFHIKRAANDKLIEAEKRAGK